MKRAIFKNFIFILTLALILSGSIFSVSISKILLKENRENMLNLLQIMDQTLNYEENMEAQIKQVSLISESDDMRFTFETYKYEELNLIAETTKKMADVVKESMKKIEFEKMIRQEFFANASHELKTPITSIRGYIELIENGMVADEDKQREFMTRIKKEAQNISALINDILMVSRLEAKEAEVVITEIRICPLINELLASLKPLAAENDISLEMNCKPIAIMANHGQIKELFNNLIVNAIKYNKEGGKVKIIATREGNDLVFIVEDTGVGIPEESKQRIFERFYRVDKGRSKKMGGTGLGLSIVKHVVNYYNGSIKLESELGLGSRFIVRLPIVN